MDIKLRPAEESDVDFAFEVKKQAMGPHIRARWGWDEKYQRDLHLQRFGEKPWFLVLLENNPIGTVSIDDQPDQIRFGEFYLIDGFRGKGIGTKILADFLIQCDKASKRAVLEYLKWNPVGSLYKRHGFKVVAENEIHYFMEREPSPH